MKLYEWEAKQLLASLGVRVPKGQVVKDKFEGKGRYVVKAQVLEGGRGKRGLVRVTDDPQSAIDEMRKLGIDVFLVEEYVPHDREAYISALLDRETGEPMIAVSPVGGVDVESIAQVRTFVIPMERGVRGYDLIKIERHIGIKGVGDVVNALYKLVTEYDAELAEINPLAVTPEGPIALDAKVIIDDNALFRHQDLLSEFNRAYKPESYVDLGGDIGIISNGAGLTMATMDMVKLMGGEPADFFDIGGGADRARVKEALLRVASNPRVKKIVINIFGGITRCDEVARGIVEAIDVIKKPVFVRLSGVNEEEGRKILAEKGINAYSRAIDAIGDALRS